MKLNKILAISLLGLSCFGLVSCGNGDGGNGSQAVQKQITLTVTGPTKTVVGQSVKLKISVRNDSTKSGYSVESSDETVATVSETGLINALSAGTTTITIASKADPSVKKELVFTVLSAEDVGVKIVADKTSVKVGETINLSANVTNKGDDKVTYKWSCENYSGSFDKTNGETAKFTTDSAGKEVIKCEYDYVSDFHEGLATVCLNDKWYFIDKTGKEVIECNYEDISFFHEGLARVRLNGKYGFIDKTGKEVIKCKYENAYDFHEGLARVQLNDKWYFIDKTGKEVIKCNLTRTNKISTGDLISSDSENLKSILDTIRKSDYVSSYYDLIIDDNRVSFSTLEERDQFEKELFIEEELKEDFEKQYTLSKK